MSDWKTIKAPKSLYLPVILDGAKGGLENTGMRVSHLDTLRVLPGSNRIEINGVEYKMMIAVDALKVDDRGFIQLDKPKPPSRLFSGGEGRASVGRIGSAAVAARQNAFTTDGPSRKRTGASHARGFPIVPEETPAYGRPLRQEDVLVSDPAWDAALQGALGKPQKTFSDDEINAAFADPNIEVREITLKDGSTAYARFDKRSGQQVGTPFRQYQARYDSEGRQIGAPAPTRGRNFDQAKYDRLMREQMADAMPAPTGHDTPRQATPKHASRTLHGPPPTPVPPAPVYMDESVATSTGSLHLDSHITAAEAGGFPIGLLTWLQGPHAARAALMKAAKATYTKSFASALGDMALLKKDQTPLIALELDDLTSPETRLALADDLPTLVEQVKGIEKAAFLLSTPRQDSKLTAFCSALVISIDFDEQDERFLKATIVSSDINPAMQGKSIMFPVPG